MTAVRWSLLLALATLLAGCSHAASTSGESVFKLKVGSCVVPPTAIKAEISSVKVVPCTTPHTQEVFAELPYGALGSSTTTSTSDNYPGVAALQTFANGACLQDFASYVGIDYRYSSLFYTYMLPSARSWSGSDRTVVCLVTTTGQPLTASVRGSRQ